MTITTSYTEILTDPAPAKRPNDAFWDAMGRYGSDTANTSAAAGGGCAVSVIFDGPVGATCVEGAGILGSAASGVEFVSGMVTGNQHYVNEGFAGSMTGGAMMIIGPGPVIEGLGTAFGSFVCWATDC